MKRLGLILAVCCLVTSCLSHELHRQVHRERSQGLLRDVDWETTRARFADLARCAVRIEPIGLAMDLLIGRGTGVVISNDGHVLTCAHVVDTVCGLPGTVPGEHGPVPASGRELEVVFSNGRSVRASLVAYNARFDLALLKISCERLERFVEPSPGLRVLPGDVLVATASEGRNEPIERLMTAGKVIVPYSALPTPSLESRYTSGLLCRMFGYEGMSGAPLFTRDGRLAGLIKKGTPGGFEDGTSLMTATAAEDIVRLLPDLMRGISDGSTFTDVEFLAERERQNELRKRLAGETNPGFERSEEYTTAVGVVNDQLARALGALEARKVDAFYEGMIQVCLLDIYTARYMYARNRCAEIRAFFDRRK